MWCALDKGLCSFRMGCVGRGSLKEAWGALRCNDSGQCIRLRVSDTLFCIRDGLLVQCADLTEAKFRVAKSPKNPGLARIASLGPVIPINPNE